jgi:hypothetical protein
LPDWFASIVHVPEAIKVADVPETVQMPVVVEVKVTAKPELAVAESVSGLPTVCAPGLAKVIVCVASVTETADDVPVALL